MLRINTSSKDVLGQSQPGGNVSSARGGEGGGVEGGYEEDGDSLLGYERTKPQEHTSLVLCVRGAVTPLPSPTASSFCSTSQARSSPVFFGSTFDPPQPPPQTPFGKHKVICGRCSIKCFPDTEVTSTSLAPPDLCPPPQERLELSQKTTTPDQVRSEIGDSPGKAKSKKKSKKETPSKKEEVFHMELLTCVVCQSVSGVHAAETSSKVHLLSTPTQGNKYFSSPKRVFLEAVCLACALNCGFVVHTPEKDAQAELVISNQGGVRFAGTSLESASSVTAWMTPFDQGGQSELRQCLSNGGRVNLSTPGSPGKCVPYHGFRVQEGPISISDQQMASHLLGCTFCVDPVCVVLKPYIVKRPRSTTQTPHPPPTPLVAGSDDRSVLSVATTGYVGSVGPSYTSKKRTQKDKQSRKRESKTPQAETKRRKK